MDHFARRASSKSTSSSSAPFKHRLSKQNFKSPSKSRKTIFESSSSDDELGFSNFSSYSGYSQSQTSRSKGSTALQTHHYQSNDGEATSSSDLDVAQMADFKPLIPKNKKQIKPSNQRNAPRNA